MSIEIDRTGKFSALGNKFADNPWKTDPDQPTALWLYDCPCGETHRLATAVTSALQCGQTGVELGEESRFSTKLVPHSEAFPAMHGGTHDDNP